jgi:hypothetical protein
VASDDWVPDESDQHWLAGVFDARPVVGDLPPGSVNLDDPAWDDAFPELAPALARVREAVRGLGDADPSVAEKSLTMLWWWCCSDGVTEPYGAVVVPSLLRAPVGADLRARILQLAGHMARSDTLRQEGREGLLRMMQPIPVYDTSGGLEGWSVEAVRAMVGRDTDLLITLLHDDSPEVRGRAAYVLAAAKPVTVDVVGVFQDRLAVEPDPAVQMILVLCIAEYRKDRDLSAHALVWARDLWSDPDAPLGMRVGGVIAWFGLTPDDPPRDLQAVRETMPMTVIGELLQELPWIYSLTNRPGMIADWWHELDTADPPDERFPTLLRTKLEATDPRALAEFYRELLDLRYRDGDDTDPLVLLDSAGVQAMTIRHVDEEPRHDPWRMVCSFRAVGPVVLDRRRRLAESLGATLVKVRAPESGNPVRYEYVDPGGYTFGISAAPSGSGVRQ